MPVVSVCRDSLFKALGQTYTDAEFDELCFRFGIELDDVTSEKLMARKEKGSEASATASEEVVYKIEVPANRYDLLCLEGISKALRVFNGTMAPPVYKTAPPVLTISSLPAVAQVRPHVVCAVLRGVRFDSTSYNSFIELQEKLHQNVCRRRTLVSVGTHDLDTIEAPFFYDAMAPSDIKFAPLNKTTPMTAPELFAHIDANDQHLRKYLPIIASCDKYPVILDNKKRVLSLPPIINSDFSKISVATKNIFIEVTATDKTKAEIVLNTICCMFAELCDVIEQVTVQSGDSKQVFPNLGSRSISADVAYVNSSVGIELSADAMLTVLQRMGLHSSLSGADALVVQIPPTRSDILHPCDIMEDVAIAYGYDNIKKTIPKTPTAGKQQPLQFVSELLAEELAHAGYTEALTFTLCSTDENYAHLRKKEDGLAVVIANPQTFEFQLARTSLLPGLLKTLHHNRHTPLPIKLFEVSDVIVQTADHDTGAKNVRKLAALHCSQAGCLEQIHGLVDRIMLLNRVPARSDAQAGGYHLKNSDCETFLEGQRADVFVGDQLVGTFGILHPLVCKNFEIVFTCAVLEMDVELFV